MAFSSHPVGGHPAVIFRGAKSISSPRVPAFLVSRRNRAPMNGARARRAPETGIRKLAAGPTVPSRNAPLRTAPNAMDAFATASSAWIWLPGTSRNRPAMLATAASPTFTSTPSPNASPSWLLAERVAAHGMMERKPNAATSVTRARASDSAAMSKQIERSRNGYRARGTGLGDSNHDPLRKGDYLTDSPTKIPAMSRRTSHDQKVALSSGRTLSYHTPLPSVDRAIV